MLSILYSPFVQQKMPKYKNKHLLTLGSKFIIVFRLDDYVRPRRTVTFQETNPIIKISTVSYQSLQNDILLTLLPGELASKSFKYKTLLFVSWPPNSFFPSLLSLSHTLHLITHSHIHCQQLGHKILLSFSLIVTQFLVLPWLTSLSYADL